ncbi:MAG TPA: ABC transporter permease [Ignavibacteriaceae bacterium]|nr:ABC transporter permease [Ignavibacteriaceae bacterium]
MNKTFAIAKWEFMEKIKTKAFLISMIITPIIIITYALLPTILSDSQESGTKLVGVLDPSNIYFKGINNRVSQFKLSNNIPAYLLVNLTKDRNLDSLEKRADREVLRSKIASYLLIKNGGTDSVKIELRSKSTANFKDVKNFEQAFNETRINLQLKKKGIDTSLMRMINSNVNLKAIKINKEGKATESDFLIVFFSSFIFIILLMLMILSSGGMLIRSLLEEKSNRLIEILVSSCTPSQLLGGKILGLSALGLFQIAIWALMGIVLVGSSAVTLETFENIPLLLIYFILGYVFYTAIFVGVGSIVSTEQEAQQITSYMSMILILPIVFAITTIQEPNSNFVHILSYFPLTTPSIMLLRLNASTVPISEIIITLSILILSILIMIIISSKIFRIGILSYGKRPSLRELYRWVKEK